MDTGLCGLELCLFGGDVPEGGVGPQPIVVSLDAVDGPLKLLEFVQRMTQLPAFPRLQVVERWLDLRQCSENQIVDRLEDFAPEFRASHERG